jgi:hypothetical protein
MQAAFLHDMQQMGPRHVVDNVVARSWPCSVLRFGHSLRLVLSFLSVSGLKAGVRVGEEEDEDGRIAGPLL